MRVALKGKYQDTWLDYLFNAYDKMHKTGTLSLPFQATMISDTTTILRPQVTCEVKIIDSDHYCELKYRMCADGSHIIMGLNYDLSYTLVIDGDSLLLMIALTTSRGMIFYFLDISNAFQSTFYTVTYSLLLHT